MGGRSCEQRDPSRTIRAMPVPTAVEAARFLAQPRLPIMLRYASPPPRQVIGTIMPIDTEIATSVLLLWADLITEMGEEDAKWTWESILGLRSDVPASSTFVSDVALERVAIVHDGIVHGILVTSLPERPPRLSRCSQLVFVEYVAVAPWNRGPTRLFKAIGPSLLELAVLRSLASGRGGCIGLHSGGPKAAEWYITKAEMKHRGLDPDEPGCHYFDGSDVWVEKFMRTWEMP
jgi:hypothetical protein